MIQTLPKPEVTKVNVLSMQVCVPTSWTDDEVLEYAEQENPCGIEGGWDIRREGSEWLKGCPERTQCAEREACVHIMLDA